MPWYRTMNWWFRLLASYLMPYPIIHIPSWQRNISPTRALLNTFESMISNFPFPQVGYGLVPWEGILFYLGGVFPSLSVFKMGPCLPVPYRRLADPSLPQYHSRGRGVGGADTATHQPTYDAATPAVSGALAGGRDTRRAGRTANALWSNDARFGIQRCFFSLRFLGKWGDEAGKYEG